MGKRKRAFLISLSPTAAAAGFNHLFFPVLLLSGAFIAYLFLYSFGYFGLHIYNINPKYMEGIKFEVNESLNFNYLKKNPAKIDEICGIYRKTTHTIAINLKVHKNLKCGAVRSTILHELKHAWCLNNDANETNWQINCMKLDSEEKIDNCMHQGCFLSTPIDKEYGFIK